MFAAERNSQGSLKDHEHSRVQPKMPDVARVSNILANISEHAN